MESDVIIRVAVTVVLVSSVGVLITVLTLTWSMPDIARSTVAPGQKCPRDNGLQFQCANPAYNLHGYLKQKVQTEYNSLHEQDEYRRKEEQNNSGLKIELQYYTNNHYWSIKPAARLTGKQQNKTLLNYLYNGEDLVPIREWNHGRDLWNNGGFLRYGMRYIRGRLVVPWTGMYHIYSFVDLYEPCVAGTGIPAIENIDRSIEHAVFKFNILDGKDIKLFSGAQPHLKSANKYYNIYSSYISSIFRLNAGDELSVKISNISYLQYTDYNYFGVHFL